jgi:hypothetical protein
MGFVAVKVALGQVSLRVLGSSPLSIIPLVLYNYLYVSTIDIRKTRG